ncbi:hypothetical protein [Streptomyces aidingensis]|uniref:hypothetical protein n=1 Tax=Streptomyces aidingensis TaxID=910347 RepID=UPI001114A2F7|nr:hypothetical protein [Streptomyces aidingensis]
MTDHDDHGLPEPQPGDTARLDHLAAHWRELPELLQQDVVQAAEELRDAPGEAVSQVLESDDVQVQAALAFRREFGVGGQVHGVRG